ncbi:hypothetical protein MKW92_023662 [Papaver armeniacum]|nr:hypothetical protein MKW92_023662 [Papaver armeniacum]
MAKLGEGDSRWIVKDRPDGTNVHNWHWAETDCLEWSKNLLNKLLSNLTILDGESNLYIKTKKVDIVTGEAYVNVRKGKIIPGYELDITLSWIGEAKGSENESLMKIEGQVHIPYLADENADEDPEIKVKVKEDGTEIGKRLKDAFVAKGLPIVKEKVRVYVQSMAKGGPCKEELEVKKTNVAKSAAVGASTAAAAPAVKKDVAVAAAATSEKKKEGKKGFKKITLKEKYNCRAKDLFEILMDENRWKGFTQSNAKISKEVGGEFSLFDGSVTGTNLELEDGKLIAWKWRFGNWADGIYSTVRITFDEPETGVTVINLVHAEVPEEDRYGNATVVENTERGWRDLIFGRIRAVFGFGM